MTAVAVTELRAGTIHDRVAAARARLVEAGVSADEADLDARLLAQEVFGWDAARYFTSASDHASPEFDARFDALVTRRSAREPVAYILGRREFWDLTFEVSPAVLIPRPETELIVEAALELLTDSSLPASIADACTGSGCLAVAIAHERPGVRVLATDLSADALAVARKNVDRHQLSGRVHLAHMDLLAEAAGPFDLIVANPPYVPSSVRDTLPPEVLKFEPTLALFGGDDGLDLVRRLIAQSATRLRTGGMFVCEFGLGQAQAISELISSTQTLRMMEVRRDLQGIERTALALCVQ